MKGKTLNPSKINFSTLLEGYKSNLGKKLYHYRIFKSLSKCVRIDLLTICTGSSWKCAKVYVIILLEHNILYVCSTQIHCLLKNKFTNQVCVNTLYKTKIAFHRKSHNKG